MKNIIQLFQCCCYGFFLGAIFTAITLWSCKQYYHYPSDIMKTIFLFASIITGQLFYIKTYKKLIN